MRLMWVIWWICSVYSTIFIITASQCKHTDHTEYRPMPHDADVLELLAEKFVLDEPDQWLQDMYVSFFFGLSCLFLFVVVRCC